jgi:hypothetical protein
MTADEAAALTRYLDRGGVVIALGPTALPGCVHSWKLPNRTEAEDFFTTVPDGVHVRTAPWVSQTEIPTTNAPISWQQPRPGLYYTPARPQEAEGLLELVRRFMKPMPIRLLQANGFLTTVMEDEAGYTLQLVAADYDVDINHELDEMRNHRSRVNLITKIEPLGTNHELMLQTGTAPTVYTPFCKGAAKVTMADGFCRITLPLGCAYALLRFEK